MRRGRFVVGIVLLLIGLLLAVATLLPAPAQNTVIPQGQDLALTNPRYTATTLTVTWSGEPSSTRVYLVSSSPTPSACSSPSAIVANGSGSSGSFSASLGAGAQGYLYGCNATTFQTVEVSVAQSGGLNLGEILGGVVAGIGAIVLALSFRAKPQDESARVFAPTSVSRGYTAPEGNPGAGPAAAAAEPLAARPATSAAAPAGGAESPPPAGVSRRSSKYVHGAPTSDGRTLRGCASCGAVSPTGSDRCPACGTPY